MSEIRRAKREDISRLAEVLVFAKRTAYRSIIRDDALAFGALQVLPVAEGFQSDPNSLRFIWVYGSDFVKGFVAVEEGEITKLFVDPFFQGEGIGEKLLTFAVQELGGSFLWALEENRSALRFYQKHGFAPTGERTQAKDLDAWAVKLAHNTQQEEIQHEL